jgi:hypothetical protein
LAGVTKEWAVDKSAAFWRQSGFWINMPDPYQIYAEHFRPERRLRRCVNIWISDAPGGTAIDMMLSGSRDDSPASGVPPLADLIPADDEREADQVMWSFWTFLDSAAEAAGRAAPPTSAPAPGKCPKCGSPVIPDARFCGVCGARLTPE